MSNLMKQGVYQYVLHGKTLIVVYKDKLIVNQLKKLIETIVALRTQSGQEVIGEVMAVSRLKTVRHYNRKRELVQEFNAEGLDTGYEYEVQACMEALESGAIECPQMPHEETIAVMKLMDRLRDDWGLKLVGE